MVLAVEIIVCCLIFGIYRVIRIKWDPAYKISNMPEKLQKKVMHMRGYRNRNIRIMTDWEKFVKKLPTLIFWTIALVILTSIAGATSFSIFTPVFRCNFCRATAKPNQQRRV